MRVVLFLIPALFALSCKKKTEDPAPGPFVNHAEKMVLLANEGNFQWGNASVGVLNLSTNDYWENVFTLQNHRALGDVFQSAAKVGDEWWLVVNNSGKIETVRASDFKSTGTITGFRSPRYALFTPNGKIVVSDLYANGLSVVDPTSKQKTGFIPLSGWTEEMAHDGHLHVWVINKRRPYLYGIHSESLTLTDSILLPGNGTSLCFAGSGKLWVGSEGTDSTKGSITLINTTTRQVEKQWFTPAPKESPGRFCANLSGNILYFLNRDVWQISAESAVFEPQKLMTAEGRNFYGLGYRALDNTLYVSDAKDFVQKSAIQVLDITTGQRKPDLKGGVITGHFYFF